MATTTCVYDNRQMAPAKTLQFQAPAKVNLILRVVGKRPDGYHELQTLMVPLSLYDTLKIVRTPGPIQVTCQGVTGLDGPNNLAYRAVEAWRDQVERIGAGKVDFGVNISIQKRIPIQAGLGGGSSDAAATLQGLQEIDGKPLPNKELYELATQLGADVPFFLAGSPCWATGIGEHLEPVLDLPRFWVLLACAPFGHQTRQVFENLKYPLTLFPPSDTRDRPKWGFEILASSLVNDLQPTGEQMHPEIGRVREELLRAGAAGAQMSGSGPSVFGLFRTREAARQASRRIRKTNGWTYLVLRAVN